MSTTSANETERKYEAQPGRPMPRLDSLPQVAAASAPHEEVLEAEYYDTDDLRLIRSGSTLRRRRGGSDAGWHLKLPLGGDTRREIRRPLGRGGRTVPAELARLVRVYTRGAALRPVARINTRRHVLTLVDAAGDSLAEIAADDVSAQTLGQETTISQWGEVEVELTGGRPGLLDDADAWLRREGLRPSSRTAKLERALADQLAEADRRTARNGQRQAPDGSAGAVVLAFLDQQVARLKALDPMVRMDEPDSVHQMRVTARRLRSTLQSFGQVIPRSRTSQLTAELKWLGIVLGAARDAEVLATRLERDIRETPPELVLGPVMARVQGHFAPVRAAARKAALAALDSERYFALLDALDDLISAPPVTAAAAQPASSVLPAEARHTYRRTANRIRRAQRTRPGPDRDVAYHEARKAAKRARYAGEAVSPAIGQPARRFTRQMKHVQTVLGDHQDAVVTRGVDRELGIGAHLAGENAFSYGLLYERESERAERLKKQANRTWRHRARPHFRRWAS
ncbi:MAG: CHAD domain-containing protein [Streptosporangiaceae bacterium]